MAVEISRRHTPGPDPNLPAFVYKRMTELGMKPTLTNLSRKMGISHVALQTYLKGEREMKLSTAMKLVSALRLQSLDSLILELPFLCKEN